MSSRESRRAAPAATSRGDRTRANVLMAATRRFRKQGFDGTTTGQIARDAGIAEGTVYLHYGSKAGLLAAVMESYYDRLVTELEEVGRGPAEVRLRELIRFWLHRMERDWPLVRVFGQYGRHPSVEVALAHEQQRMNRRVTRLFEAVIDDVKAAGAFRSEIPTRILRDVIFGTAEHLILATVHTGRRLDVDAAAEDLIDVVWNGAAPRAGSTPTDLASMDAKLDALLDLAGQQSGRRY